MSFMIQWTNQLDRTQRRWLRGWLDRFGTKHPGLVEQCGAGIIVRHTTPDQAHSFAALTMAVVGQPVFAYSIEPLAEQVHSPAAA
jgi:hypothetical protein